MTRLRIDLAYDGGPFAGFARQPEQHTVQGTLGGALSRLLGFEPATTCAGRTDKGVHALAQVVHLDLDPEPSRTTRFLEDVAATRTRIDQLVGPAITIWAVTEVAEGFDARFSATQRGYRYRLSDQSVVDPRLRGLRWHVGAALDVAAMEEAAPPLLGEHDFAALCRQAEGKHTVRRIDRIAIERTGGEIHVTVRGKAFCHQQVRSIVGCLVAVGRGQRPAGWLADVLASRDRSLAADVAPAHGLTLEHVAYPDPWPDAPFAGVSPSSSPSHPPG